MVTQIPNVYERLAKEGIVVNTLTAGLYKRTLTLTGKVEQKVRGGGGTLENRFREKHGIQDRKTDRERERGDN